MSGNRPADNKEELDSKLAILIDADNTPYGSIKQILDACARFGRAIIKRAYGDWTTSYLQSWNEVFKEYAIKPMQQFQYTTGKNVSDSALIIDAMDILHQKSVDTFILVTSDSDFTGLATRIREEGLTVIGIGRMTTPASFVKGCDQFLLIENLTGTPVGAGSEGASAKAAVTPVAVPKNIPIKNDGKELLIRAVEQAKDENGFVKGAKLGVILKRLDPTFSPANYGARKLADFVDRHPDVVKLVGKRTATDPTYQVVK
ncbi:MAG: NYN domain-containing protein [Thaumarchaeota archaeon]|nr:NYN domain-containing protein [Nitrososphaerota archaeon]